MKQVFLSKCANGGLFSAKLTDLQAWTNTINPGTILATNY